MKPRSGAHAYLVAVLVWGTAYLHASPPSTYREAAWKLLEDHNYQAAVDFLRNGNRAGLLNLINRDPPIARRALLRLLEDQAHEWAKSFAELFAQTSPSELEEPFVEFYFGAPGPSRRELLRWLRISTDAELVLDRFWANDRLNRQAWMEALTNLEEAARAFHSLGFTIGEAYCLSRWGYTYTYDTRPLQTIAPVQEKALALFHSAGNLYGEAKSLDRLLHLYGGKEEQAKEFKNRALEKASLTGDPSFESYLILQLPLRAYGDAEREKLTRLWPLISQREGWRLQKYTVLALLGRFEDYREMLAGEQDPILQIKAHWTLSSWVGNNLEALAEVDQAIELAGTLPYDMAAYDHSGGPAVPSMLIRRAGINGELGKIKESETDLRKALEILGSSPRTVDAERLQASAHWELAMTFKALGDYPAAIAETSTALAIQQRMENDWGVIWTYRVLSQIYADLGDLAQAELLLEKARLQHDPFFNPSDIFLAELHLSFYRYHEALQDLDRAEAAFRKMGEAAGKLSGSWMNIRWNLLAALWLRLGDHTRALEASEKVERTNRAMLGMEIYEHFTPKGLVLAAMGRHQEAEQYFQDRLARARQQPYRLGEAEALKNLGRIYRAQGLPDKAAEHLSQALTLYLQLGHPRRALEVLLELGLVKTETQELRSAADYFSQALALAEEIQQPEGIWSARYQLGRMAARTQATAEAIAQFKVAVEAIESVAGRIRSEFYKSSFLEDKIVIYDDLIRLLAASDARAKQQAFLYSERRRARALLESMQKVGLGVSPKISPELQQRRQHLESLLIGKQKALLELYSKPAQKRDPARIEELRKELKSIRERHGDLQKLVQLRYPYELLGDGSPAVVSIPQLQNQILKPGQALIEYVVTDREIFAFVVTKNSFELQQLRISRSELQAQVEALNRPYRDLKLGSVDLLHLHYDLRLAHRIFSQIFAPFEPLLKEAKDLIIVPDDILYYVPFESLLRTESSGPKNPLVRYGEYQTADWLVRRYTISYAVAASTLRPRDHNRATARAQLLAFGDPDVGAGQETNLASARLRGFDPGAEVPSLSPLPESAREVRTVADRLGTLAARLLLGKEANERMFFQQAPGASYIHFAVHSLLNEQQPYYSGLVLSPEKNTDGLLQGFEIARADLNCRLVTLSACETGLGKLQKGEGLLGLTHSFLQAGAQSALVSLWSIDDSTADFMALFYDHLQKGDPLPTALQQTKLKYLNRTVALGGKSRLSLSHPFFWAPFVLTTTRP